MTREYPWAWTTDQWDSYLSALAAGWGSTGYAAETTAWLTPSLADDPEQRIRSLVHLPDQVRPNVGRRTEDAEPN